MRQLRLIPILLILSSFCFGQNTKTVITEEWIKKEGNPIELPIKESLVKMAIDPSGNIITLANKLVNSEESNIEIICKLANGSTAWQHTFNNWCNKNDISVDMVVDGSGNIYVTGATYDDNTSSYDIVTRKYDASGLVLWTEIWNNSSSNANDIPSGIALDNQGNAYVVGTTEIGAGNSDMVTIRYQKNSGSIQWTEIYDYAGWLDIGTDIELTSSNKVVITGASGSTALNSDITVIKYNQSNGSMMGSPYRYLYAGNGYDFPRELGISNANKIYVVGNVSSSGMNYDVVTIKLNGNLNHDWDMPFDNIGFDDQGKALAIGQNSVYVGGYVTNMDGKKESLVIKYDQNGNQEWMQTKEAENVMMNAEVSKLAVNSTNDVYVTGKDYNTSASETRTTKYTDGGSEKWTKTYSGELNGTAQGSDIKVQGNDIYVSGTSKETTGDKVTTIKYSEKDVIIPTDYYGEEAGTPYTFWQNKGQVANTSGTSAKEVVYYNTNTYPAIYQGSTAKVSYVFTRVDTIGPDTIPNDTLHRIDMTFANSSGAKVSTYGKTHGFQNFYMAHTPEGRERVSGVERLVYPRLYTNIDFHTYSNDYGMKYYFVSYPSVHKRSIDDIVIKFDGAISVTKISGDLVVKSAIGTLTIPEPVAYHIDGNNNILSNNLNAQWVLSGNIAKLSVSGNIDNGNALVVQVGGGQSSTSAIANENLWWSTYYGNGGDDDAWGVFTDVAENSYIVGRTNSATFPLSTAPFQTVLGGWFDAFLTKFDPNGVMVYSTIYGGSTTEEFNTLDFNSAGDIYVAGGTQSGDFPYYLDPADVNAYYDNTTGSGTYMQMIIVKFDQTLGSRMWATGYGDSNGNEGSSGLKIDNQDNIFIAGGGANWVDFPLVDNGGFYRDADGMSFVCKIKPDHSIDWSSIWGDGSPERILGMDVDKQGNLYICGRIGDFWNTTFDIQDLTGAYTQNTVAGGRDGYVAVFDPSQNLVYSQFFGGAGDDEINHIEVRNDDKVYITGLTNSDDFPLLNNGIGFYNGIRGGQDAFLGVFDAKTSGTFMEQKHCTYLGGSGSDEGMGIATSTDGQVYVVGKSQSDDIDIVTPANSFSQSDINGTGVGDQVDGFIMAFSTNNEKIWTTYMGGNRDDGNDTFWERLTSVDVTASNVLYVTGMSEKTAGVAYPTENPGGGAWYSPITFGENDAVISQFDLQPIIVADVSELIDRGIDFSVYPNPTTRLINVTLPEVDGTLDIKLYNEVGQIVITELNQTSNNTVQIDVSGLARGTYLITVNGKELSSSGKFIIR